MDHMESHSESSSLSSRRSSKGSSRSSKSSLLSSRAKEKIRLAELVTERAILRQRQALQAAKEELELELEIAKSEARDKILTEIDMQNKIQHSYHYGLPKEDKLDQAIFKISDSLQSVASFIPPPVPSMKYPAELISEELTQRATDLVPGKDEQIPGHTKPPIFTSTAIKNPPYESKLNPAAQPFHEPSSHTSRSTAANIGNNPMSYSPTVHVMEQSFQEVMAMQRQQNEQIIDTHKQLASAMTLPQPIVPTFYGDPISYKTFILAFEARIHSRTNTNSDRLYYLTQHVEREPKELIEGCLYMDPDEGYAEARRLLDKEYGDPFKISTAYIRKLTSWVPIRLDDPGALKRLSIFLTRCQNAMKGNHYLDVLDHAPNLQTIVSKLPFGLQNKWRDRVVKTKRCNGRAANFEDLTLFIEQTAESANDPVYGKEALQRNDESKFNKVKDAGRRNIFSKARQTTSLATDLKASSATAPNGAGHAHHQGVVGSKPYQGVASSKQCPLCGKGHDLDDCESFKKKTIEEKVSFLQERRMCFACYGRYHISKVCTRRKTCYKCGKLHPTAMHIENFKMKDRESKETKDGNQVGTAVNSTCTDIDKEPSSSYTSKTENSIVLHAILPVKVRTKDKSDAVVTYALYDNGSSGCFMTESLKEQLDVEGIKTTLQLGTMHGQSCVDSDIVEGLVVTDIKDNNPIELTRCYTRCEIPVSQRQIPTAEVVSQFDNLHDISKEIPKLIPDLEVGILIGSNCPLALEPLEVRPSGGKGPFAMRLRHGWTVSGPLCIQAQTASQDSNTSSYRITVRELESIKEVITPKSVLTMFELDFNDRPTDSDKHGYSQED